jgi:hypothetical protein
MPTLYKGRFFRQLQNIKLKMFIMYFTLPIQRKPKENTELTPIYESACRFNLQIIVMWFFGVFQQKTEYQEWAGSFEKNNCDAGTGRY